ncbi:MAG TPA: AI-2E family transporter, partial [Sphingomonadaceae bacterium]|nr:AI-2E family transporter [Sphingomonadaceae bacterium]
SGVGTVTRALSGLLGGIASMILIGFLGIYISLEPRLYERGIAWMLPEDRREDFYITGSLMARQLRHLLGGRLFGMVVEGIFTWAMLAGYALVNDGVPVPMAVLLGLITGTLAFIPNVGAVISGVLMVLVGFSGGTEMGFYTVFVYFFVQTIDGNILVPLIAKKTVDLAPALVLATQLILGVMFGVLGLALADPLVAMIKVALERRSAKYDAVRDAQTEVQAEAV